MKILSTDGRVYYRRWGKWYQFNGDNAVKVTFYKGSSWGKEIHSFYLFGNRISFFKFKKTK